AAGDVLEIKLAKNPLASARISVSPIAPLAPTRPLLDDVTRTTLQDPASASATTWRVYLSSVAAGPPLTRQLRATQQEVWECRDGKSSTLVTEAWKPAITRVLPRGNWQDESGEIVEPATPHF